MKESWDQTALGKILEEGSRQTEEEWTIYEDKLLELGAGEIKFG